MQVTAPQAYQVVQRSGTTGTITITGTIKSGTHSIEASWNGGAWATIATSATTSFSGSLTSQDQGSGVLYVRYADQPWEMATVNPVGIGDVFVIAGQSNGMGYGLNNQTNSGTWAGGFGKDYNWHKLVDPSDMSTGALDAVSNNTGAQGGSVWPLVAGRFSTNNLGFPIAFVPCAASASSITLWQPSGGFTNRSSLYGSMTWRSKYAAGGAKAVLWWQGEYEAKYGAATQYHDYTNFSSSVFSDQGIKVMPCKLESLDGTYPNLSTVNANYGTAWSDDPNTITGPDLSGITPSEIPHLRSDSNLAAAAELWWNAIKAAFYP